jgi:hypothetical protein
MKMFKSLLNIKNNHRSSHSLQVKMLCGQKWANVCHKRSHSSLVCPESRRQVAITQSCVVYSQSGFPVIHQFTPTYCEIVVMISMLK